MLSSNPSYNVEISIDVGGSSRKGLVAWHSVSLSRSFLPSKIGLDDDIVEPLMGCFETRHRGRSPSHFHGDCFPKPWLKMPTISLRWPLND